MSLLLDALRTDPSAPSSAEPHEEALDGRDALKILTANLATPSALTLEASPPSLSAIDAAVPPDVAAVPRETGGAPRNPTLGHTATPVRPGLAPLPRAPAHSATPARRIATMLAVAIGVVTIVMLGKSLLHKNSTPITYPEVPQVPAAAAPPASPPDPNAVQVPSRPASQFSGVGGAPEIDLHENLRPASIRRPARPIAEPGRADKPREALRTGAPDPSTPGSLSVVPSTGVASVDVHIESGYRALASGDIAGAQREYHAALDLDANNVDALLGAASAASRAGDSMRAVAAYAKVLKVEPGNPDASAALAILNRDPTAAENNESRLKVMIAADSERGPALHVALAGVYAADRRWADAAQEYFIALSLDPNDAELAFNLAASLDQNHNRAAALTYYSQALALAKQHAAPIDVHAVEARISQLQAHIDVPAAAPRAAP